MITALKILLSVFSSIKSRSEKVELMDSEACDTLTLYRTLDQFVFVNTYLNGLCAYFNRSLIPHMKSVGQSSFTIADLGSGGCEIPLFLLNICKNENLVVTIYCIDCDQRTSDYAKQKVKNVKEIKVVTGDALEIIKTKKFDYIISNHFLHHLPDHAITTLLQSVNFQSRHGFLFNDLVRSRTSLFLYFIVASLFLRKSFTLPDGIDSIKKGFTIEDLLHYKEHSKTDFIIDKIPPGHICIRNFY